MLRLAGKAKQVPFLYNWYSFQIVDICSHHNTPGKYWHRRKHKWQHNNDKEWRGADPGPVAAAPSKWFYAPSLLALHCTNWLRWAKRWCCQMLRGFPPCTLGWQLKSCHQLFFSWRSRQKSEALILEMKPGKFGCRQKQVPCQWAG